MLQTYATHVNKGKNVWLKREIGLYCTLEEKRKRLLKMLIGTYVESIMEIIYSKF